MINQIYAQPLYARERTPIPTEQEARCVVEQDWTFWIREKYFAPVGISSADSPARSLVTSPTAAVPLLSELYKVHIRTAWQNTELDMTAGVALMDTASTVMRRLTL